jgi:hypothetical protein
MRHWQNCGCDRRSPGKTGCSVAASEGAISYPFAFFAAACRAFSAATILARPSGLSPPFFFTSLAAGAEAPFFFAHLARCAAAILARDSAETNRFPDAVLATGLATGVEDRLLFAHRARCAAAILSRASADIVRLPVFAAGADTVLRTAGTDPPPTRPASSA